MASGGVRALPLACLALLAGLVVAYDTGHHFDLTENAMRLSGFSRSARETAAMQNWVVDFLAQTPTVGGEDAGPLCRAYLKRSPSSQSGKAVMFAGYLERRAQCELLHFDNLYNNDDVRAYWAQLASNAREAAAWITSSTPTELPKEFLVLSLVGFSLHAVQDFYTHRCPPSLCRHVPAWAPRRRLVPAAGAHRPLETCSPLCMAQHLGYRAWPAGQPAVRVLRGYVPA
jgi:hypothetical protein